MGVFSMREPRRIEHKYIYYDERKEKLQKIEENAKRELGLIRDEDVPYDPNHIRGKFIEGTKHLKRRKQFGANPVPTPVIVAILVGMLFLLHYLITGQWFF